MGRIDSRPQHFKLASSSELATCRALVEKSMGTLMQDFLIATGIRLLVFRSLRWIRPTPSALGAAAWLALITLVGSSAALASDGQADQPRVTIVQTPVGKVVRAGDGTLLRGGAVWVFQYGRRTGHTDYIDDPTYWDAMKQSGLNAVRLIAFDPWQRSHGDPTLYPNGYEHADLGEPEDVAALLRDMDEVVDAASENGMYVMINYHDTGGYRDPDHKEEGTYGGTMSYATRFWAMVAPRYADRTHVFYELTNEPVKWFASDYQAEHLKDFYELYDLVRAAAPSTHIVLLSFANTHSPKAQGSMLTVADRLQQLGIDFGNASVGFHPYSTGGTSAPIVELMNSYPVINTEQNFPGGVGVVTDSDTEPMDNELLGVQTMERLGISWFHWKIDGPGNLRSNGKMLREDARAKGYVWP
jgi:hypothetical protein